MKLTIFGATGRKGTQLVKKALSDGYQVTAYVRNPSKLTIQDSSLKVVQGEINDTETIASAIAGSDAVLSGLGAVRGGPSEIMAPAASSIIAGMNKENVKRLIWATGAGVPAEGDQPAFINKLIGFLLKLTAGKVLEDSLAGVELIKTSGLDWVIAREPMLTDDPGNGHYRTGLVNAGMGRTLSRENFAAAMLAQIESDAWLRRMPVFSDM